MIPSWPVLVAPVSIAWSDLMSRLLAMPEPERRDPRPVVYDLADVCWRVADVARAYNGDGIIDFSEHPARVQWHLVRRQLGRLRIDCDDVAMFAYWLLYGQPWVDRLIMANVYDETIDPGRGALNLSHAVLWATLKGGTRLIIDTNIVDPEGGYRGPAMTPEDPIQYCQRMYGGFRPRYVHWEERHWPFEEIAS